MADDTLKTQIEAALFISGKPLSLTALSRLMKVKPEELAGPLAALAAERNTSTSGIHLIQHNDTVQLVSNPLYAELLQGLAKDEFVGELTRPQLETLSIVCYRGPVTKPEIEQIRGVNCSLILRNLLIRGLVDEQDDTERLQPVYTVTTDFVRYLGLHNLHELPEFERFAKDDRITKLMEEALAPIDSVS